MSQIERRMGSAALRRRALAGGVAAGASLAAMLGLTADAALAATTAQVRAGTLEVRGDGASEAIALRLQAGAPNTLVVDAGEDGTADFTFDRVFLWDPGDGNDTVEGQGGDDQMDVNGSNAPEIIDITANGPRVRLTRNVGSITMDLGGVEGIAVLARGSIDAITVGDLSGTELRTADVDLSPLGAGGGDSATDTVAVTGTDRADRLRVARSGSLVFTTGLRVQTRIVGSEEGIDTLRVNTLDGDDEVSIAPGVDTLITPVIDLGAGE